MPPAPPASLKALVCVDFDGTIVDPDHPDPDHAFPQELATALGALRDNGVAWAIATGRSLFQAVDGLNRHAIRPLPEFLITSERELFQRSQLNRWLPVGKWNARCAKDHRKLFKGNRRFFDEIRSFINSSTSARFIDTPQEPACIVASTEPEMESICAHLDAQLPRVRALAYERNSVYLRFSHASYSKGHTLAELARQLGLPPSNIFAAGDNHNDRSMLVPGIASMLACPGNAVPAVREAVSNLGGFVSDAPAGQGTLEALRHYFGDLTVSQRSPQSSLPS